MIKDIIIHRRGREGSAKGKHLNHPPDALEGAENARNTLL